MSVLEALLTVFRTQTIELTHNIVLWAEGIDDCLVSIAPKAMDNHLQYIDIHVCEWVGVVFASAAGGPSTNAFMALSLHSLEKSSSFCGVV